MNYNIFVMSKLNSLKTKKIFTYLCLSAYIVCAGVLIFEASMDGPSSGNQSNAVGSGIADIINGAGGDTSIAIIPTKTTIKNKIEKAYVGDTYQIATEVEPNDATFKSIIYSATPASVATISETGMISFLNEGQVTIEAKNASYPDLTDTFTINVLPINVDRYNVGVSYLDGNVETTLQPSDAKYYDLYVDVNYKINVTVLPENASNKSYTITSSSSNFKISNNQISPIKTSSIYESIKISGEKQAEIFVKIIDNPNTFVPFTSLEFKNSTEEIFYMDVNSNTNISGFSPKYNNGTSIPTYKTVAYQSLDESILKISNGTIYPLLEGTATIKMYSTKYPDIFATKKVNVLYKKLNKFSLLLGGKSSNASMYLGSSSKLTISNFNPSDFTYKSKINDTNYFKKTFSSSNSNVINVDKNGNIKGLTLGTSKITLVLIDIKGNEITSSLDITVKEKPLPPKPIEYTITKINYSNSLNELEIEGDSKNYMYTNKTYNLDNYFKIDSIEGTNTNYAPKTKKILVDSIYDTYERRYIEQEKYSDYVEISKNSYRFLRKCVVDFYFIHTDSSFTTYFDEDDSFKFYVINIPYKPDIQVNEYNKPTVNKYEEIGDNYTIDLKVGNTYYLTFVDEYSIDYTNPNKIIELTYSDSFSGNRFVVYEIKALKSGIINLDIASRCDGIKLNNPKVNKKITLNISGIPITDFDFDLLMNDEVITTTKINENHQPVYEQFVGDKLDIKYLYSYDDTPTEINNEIISSNPSAVSINGNSINMKKAGKSLLNFKETYSNVEKTIQIDSYNIIKIDSEYSLILKGKFNSQDEDGTIHIYTAKSIKISFNFSFDTTYKNTTFTSSEDKKDIKDKFFEVAKDGTITTIKKGKGEVKLIINDGFTPFDETINNGPRTVAIPIQVDIKPLINEDNISHFLLLIRKSLGHFGAFLVFGIFSTFFYLFQFDKKKWFFSVPVNFLQGLALATLTELIQVFVPGRAGLVRDVWIDFSGFAIAALIITIGIIAIYFIKKAIKKKKE